MQRARNNDLYHFPTERKKGVIGTIIFHIVLVALLVFTGFHKPEPPPVEEGILVNFGYDDTGSGLMEPVASSSAAEESSASDEGITDPAVDEIIEEVTASVEEVSEAVEEEILTQDFEEAPEVEKKVEKPDPVEEARKKAEAEKVRLQKLEDEKIRKAEEEAERIKKAEEEAERIRQAEIEAERIIKAKEEARIKREAEELERRRNAIINRTKNALNTEGTGTGTNTNTSQGVAGGEGNQGVESGSIASNKYGDGSGTGTEGVSFDLAGRQARSTPKPKYDIQSEGIVVVEVTVDRNGNVTNATPGVKGSTTLEEYFLRVAREAAMTAKFDRKPDAPVIQKGTITYHFILR
ncbi:MAG: cell envelope integrity protein TolA [Bacteroidales bacterium]|nr:cell envelope integrity protein TolA [Bacteroidales bacterium]